MRVLCYGAGAVGSLIGGRLSRSGAAGVTVLARRSHVAAIRTGGLTIETTAGTLACKRVDSITALDDLQEPPDLVILTVKAYQTAEALADLRGLLARGARVLTLQNGIGNEETLAAVAGPARTTAGALTISVSLMRPGVVRQHTDSGGVALAALDAGPVPEELVALFRQAGFRTEAYPDYRAVKWSKLLLNMLGNASSAILDLPPEAIIADRRLFAIEREAFHEAESVMAGLGVRPVPLPGYAVPLLTRVMAAPQWAGRPVLARRIGRGRGAKMPSLWEDLERGRAGSEVEALNGAVAKEGARLGIATPVNALLAGVLLALVSGQRDRQEFRRNPGALLTLRAGLAPA